MFYAVLALPTKIHYSSHVMAILAFEDMAPIWRSAAIVGPDSIGLREANLDPGVVAALGYVAGQELDILTPFYATQDDEDTAHEVLFGVGETFAKSYAVVPPGATDKPPMAFHSIHQRPDSGLPAPFAAAALCDHLVVISSGTGQERHDAAELIDAFFARGGTDAPPRTAIVVSPYPQPDSRYTCEVSSLRKRPYQRHYTKNVVSSLDIVPFIATELLIDPARLEHSFADSIKVASRFRGTYTGVNDYPEALDGPYL